MVYRSAIAAGQIQSNESLMQEAFALGKKLVAE